jgi:hypothetical protein
VCGAVFALGVPGHPKLGIFFTKRRDKFEPSVVCHRFGFVDPSAKNAGLGLDAIDVAVEADESEVNAPADSADVFVAKFEGPSDFGHGSDRGFQFFKRAIFQRVHELPGAEYNALAALKLKLVNVDHKHKGKRACFAAAPSTVGTAHVCIALKDGKQRFRNPDLGFHSEPQ